MKTIALIIVFLFSFSAAAEERLKPVVVSACRLETPEEKVASSFTVITAEQIEVRGKELVSDLLREVPGLHVARSGSTGSNTTVFMRGMEGRNTLVLIDGVPANDALGTDRSFDWGNLQAVNVDRIEIIRGPQSVLYGSSAVGGVIQIFLKRGGEKLVAKIDSEVGSHRTLRTQGSVAGSKGDLNYSMGVSFLSSEGISQADERLPGNIEKDPFFSTTANGSFGYRNVGPLDFRFSSQYTDATLALDSRGGPNGDDPNYTQHNREFAGQFEMLTHRLGWINAEARLGYQNFRRESFDGIDSSDTTATSSKYLSQRFRPLVQLNAFLNDQNTTTLGLEYEQEQGRIESSSPFKAQDSTRSAFIQHQIATDAVFANLGARLDHHSQFGSAYTYRLAPGVNLPTETTFKASVGTGFFAPSLYHLHAPGSTYGSTFYPLGNSNLKPEKTFSFDLGVEQGLQKHTGMRAKLGSTFFRNHTRDFIDYTSSGGYQNVNRVLSYGVESFLTAAPVDRLEVSAQHTFNLAINQDTRTKLARRPMHKWSLDSNYFWSDHLSTGLNVQFVGVRMDIDPQGTVDPVVKMESYTLFGLRGLYKIKEDLKVSARFENLLDKKYQEINGYGTSGRSLFVGLSKDL